MSAAGASGEPRAPRVVAGIDEAGLGPLLGPLTLGYAALRLPARKLNVWDALAGIVSRDPKQDAEHLVVADSKRVFSRNPRGERRLESTALCFLGSGASTPPRSGAELLRTPPAALRPRAADIQQSPWYQELPTSLPIWVDPGRLELRQEYLRRELERNEIALVDAGVRVVPAIELNRSFARTDNKSHTVWEVVEAILRHLWLELATENLHVIVDRQGGRFRYGRLLQRGFPGAQVRVGHESPDHSEYHIEEQTESGRRRMWLTFAEKAEDRSFTVALGSCFAKYARELCMGAFNAYFSAAQPGLAPTAGYTTDGRRWLEEAAPLLETLALPREVLARRR